MQTAMYARAVILLTVVGTGVDAFSLRGPKQATLSGNISLARSVQVSHEDVDYEVVEKTSINKSGTSDCLCKIGSFWHWRIKSCVEQGGWGYECGFFPEEHHKMVCHDKLKCEVLDQSTVKYQHPGAVPASCQSCAAADKCLEGETRHAENCLKEYKLTGEACQTVRVTVGGVTASAEVTEKVTKTAEATATAKATATEKAEVKVDGQKGAAEASATAEGKATAKAEGEGKASAKAEATEDGVAEGKACVTIEEAKKLLDLAADKKIGAVLTAQVIAKGDEEAFDRAYAKALEEAKKMGLINAEDAAKALATQEAHEHAVQEAKAKAAEAAAWAAEAGASKDAQAKASAAAMGKAQAAAQGEAQAAADAASAAAAKAEAAEAAAEAAASKAEGSSAQAAADAAAAKAAAAEARADADAAAAAAAEAKARNDAISDVVNGQATQAPVRQTTPEPTNAPRKITPEQIAAKLP